jgi:Fe-S-cluster-containing hydrogenase component 2/CRP-like cAMP-binding protein
MAKQLMPRAELEARSDDINLNDEQFAKLSLFSQLKRKVSLDKYPGALRLRHFKKGDVICRQGEAGWTAFYILTTEDALAIRQEQLENVRDNERRTLEAEITRLEQRGERMKSAPPEDDVNTVATVHLAVARNPRARGGGLKDMLKPRAGGGGPAIKNKANQTVYIPMDGPVTISYDSLRADLREGELFGEMSCLYRTPRSATIVARRDCYMLELLRNILDQIQRDPAYKAKADEIYKKRSLELQIRKLSVFSDLTDDQYAEIQNNVELVSYDPGALICDEFERSDSLYIVRSGLIKVMKNVSWLLPAGDVKDWKGLAAALTAAGGSEGGDEADARGKALGKLWALLPEGVRNSLQQLHETGKLDRPQQMEIVYALNDLIKTAGLVDHEELKGFLEQPPFSERAAELLRLREQYKKKKKDWSEPELRRTNRLLLDTLFPEVLQPRWNKEVPLPAEGSVGPEVILTYLSRGDYFGEIGLMEGRARSATCIAYGHPNDFGQVDLVRLPGRVFWKLLRTSPPFRDKVKEEVSHRRLRTMDRLLRPVWDDSTQVQTSEHFEELGLLQGQRLFLIDLDRCTRCDECVKACVNTHEDGRSRLFLDGPRFGKYLVATTCRACLDPVCMIGCPVGSIHRGDNREIIIEDWCIGCSLCADQCPYGSIQMHDLGIIPAGARGWRFLPGDAVTGEDWRGEKYRDAGWLVGDAPFYLDRETREQLLSRREGALRDQEFKVLFRYDFHLSREVLAAQPDLKLEITTKGKEVKAWLNGHELATEGRPRQGRHEFKFPQPLKVDGVATAQLLRPGPGTNVLAAEVTVGPEGLSRNDMLFQARLDEIRRPEVPGEKMDEQMAQEITEKLVTERAVVCDLCSDSFGQVPACVNACPHDAAMRVDARVNFPMR